MGYVGYFELNSGFKKTVYWTKQEVELHRQANNKLKDKTKLSGVWLSDYDAMARKTVLRNMLSKWGILSIEMQSAVSSDEKSLKMDSDNNIIEETTIEEDLPPARKEAEKVEDTQQELFDDKN